MLNPDDLAKLVASLKKTRETEFSCDDCFEQLDRFVETELSGHDAASAMPLVQEHLKKCDDCQKEYNALLRGLRASNGSLPVALLWARVRRMLFGDG